MSSEQLKALGRWSSSAVSKYIRIQALTLPAWLWHLLVSVKGATHLDRESPPVLLAPPELVCVVWWITYVHTLYDNLVLWIRVFNLPGVCVYIYICCLCVLSMT